MTRTRSPQSESVHGSKSQANPQDLEGRPPIPGFAWGDTGLFRVTTKVSKDGEKPDEDRTWIAPPFTILGLERDRCSSGWKLRIAWKDLDHIEHEASLPFELIHGDGLDLCRLLGQGGMILPPEVGPRKHLLRYLSQAATRISRRVRSVDSLGWQGRAFILPNGETVGDPLEPVRFVGETPGTRDQARAGTLDNWKSEVASYAVGNPRLAFGIACAFAGPLLGMLRPDGGGGFNLQGASSKGKTTVLEVAASVWQSPDQVPTWRATSNGLEGIAAARNDGFLPLDELSQVDPKEAGNTAYMLANGRAKARATKEGEARSMKQWRLVFLSSGEQGLEDKLAEEGRRVRAGQEVRVPDIPCPEEGMFADPHHFQSCGVLAEHLKAQARKHYGHAARSFLQKLCDEIDQRESLVAKLKQMETDWLNAAVPKGADPQVHRVAGRFALVAVAGELAQMMGIVPWPEGEAAKAARVCFQAWLDRRGFAGASEGHRAVEGVLDFLGRNGQGRFDEWGEKEAHVNNRVGTRRKAAAPVDGWDYFFTAGGWREACAGLNPTDVARACMNAGILKLGAKGETSPTVHIPGHGKPRCYVVTAQGVADYRERQAS
jgi:uncharacterized protein (DUF927 family)